VRKQNLQKSDPFHRPKAKVRRIDRLREILDIDV
jgi:hypothetical protein